MTYCSQCGAEMKEEETRYFDRETGKKVMRKICSAYPCQHNSHDDETISNSYWFGERVRCRRCNREDWARGL